MDSDYSSPVRGSPLNLMMKEDSVGESSGSKLNPVIYYNPEESKDEPYKNMHRKKIFDSKPRVSKLSLSQAEERVGSINERGSQVGRESQGGMRSTQIQKMLENIQLNIQEIEDVLEKKEETQRALVERVEGIVAGRQKELEEREAEVEETQRRIQGMIRDTQSQIRQTNTLKMQLKESLLKENDQKIKEKEKEHERLMKDQVELQVLNYKMERSRKEYERIKESLVNRDDYRLQISEIQKRVVTRQALGRKEQSRSSDSFPINQEIEAVRHPQREEEVDLNIFHSVRDVETGRTGERLSELRAIEETPAMKRGDVSKLYVTQSSIYPFDEPSRMAWI